MTERIEYGRNLFVLTGRSTAARKSTAVLSNNITYKTYRGVMLHTVTKVGLCCYSGSKFSPLVKKNVTEIALTLDSKLVANEMKPETLEKSQPIQDFRAFRSDKYRRPTHFR